MIAVMGGITVIAGCIMLVLLLRQIAQPKIQAHVDLVEYKVAEGSPHQKKHLHGTVTYSFRGEQRSQSILLKTTCQPGARIPLSVNPKNGKVVHYSPVREALATIIVFVVGFVMIGLSYYIANKLS
ncbi:MAG TPA: hypothetical protein DCE42_28410 [Myxococcales bacterium]|nr:hypothetical protein [Deltaproteobacteria bacterium]MBU50174.1 hypothetical protein [Deltaproteobacteria bacterium]HAA58719.1 hypothetical protein [Myxococcales bacterium]|tara:strand:- start:6076 stop:6453 length:378 start_codon:yes stop_codon:yes gene_type:complete